MQRLESGHRGKKSSQIFLKKDFYIGKVDLNVLWTFIGSPDQEPHKDTITRAYWVAKGFQSLRKPWNKFWAVNERI